MFSFSVMERAVSVLSATEGVNAELGWVSVKLFFSGSAPGFPLKGFSSASASLQQDPI